MTIDEIQQLRKRDIIYVPFVVDKVKENFVSSYLPRTEDTYYFTADDIVSWKRQRRLLRKGDVVVTVNNTITQVSRDEDEDGVGLDFLPENARRSASELTLVMTAEEYAERMGKKGGSDD